MKKLKKKIEYYILPEILNPGFVERAIKFISSSRSHISLMSDDVKTDLAE